jgi:hypothetical protein
MSLSIFLFSEVYNFIKIKWFQLAAVRDILPHHCWHKCLFSSHVRMKLWIHTFRMKNDIPGLEAILGWKTWISMNQVKAIQMYKVFNDLAPNELVNLFVCKSDITDYELRGSSANTFSRTWKPKKVFLMMGWNCVLYPQICVIRIHCWYL